MIDTDFIANLDKLCLNTVHLPGSDMVLLVLGTSHHLSGYLRPHAAQLMDKCVNMRSIWFERPHKPHFELCNIKVSIVHVTDTSSARKAYGVVRNGSK